MYFRYHFVYLLLFISTAGHCASVDTDIFLTGNPIGCKSTNSQLKRIQMQGEVLLNKNFLPQNETNLEQLKKDAIEIQIKHLMGFFKNTSANKLNAALSAYRGSLSILKTEGVKYGSSLKIENYLPSSRDIPKSDYIQKALKRGFTNKEDEALLIQYQIEILVADCTPKNFTTEQKIVLPKDPYLSLWLEDKSNRKPRIFGSNNIQEVSNCSSNEIVSFGTPNENWYFWDPLNSSRSKRCQMDATSVYQPQFIKQNEVKKVETIDKSYFKKLDKLKFTAIFGTIDQSRLFAQIDLPKLKEFSQQNFTACKNTPSIPQCLTLWEKILGPQEDNKYYEPGVYYFLQFLKYIHTMIKIQSFKINETNLNEFLITINGTFIDSTQSIELQVYYGKTTLDYGPKVSKNYVNLFHKSLSNSNIISYVGHAGLGQNFNLFVLENLWKDEKLKPIIRQNPLWVGIYNCEAFSYFGFDLKKIFKTGTLDIILTESSGTESGAKFPLSQLNILSKIYSDKPQRVDMADMMNRYVMSREFLTVMRLRD